MFTEIELDRRTNVNRLFVNEYGEGYLTVYDQARETAGLKQRAFWLDGGSRQNADGELIPIYQLLADFIAKNGAFYDDGAIRTNGIDGKHYTLAAVLLSIYSSVSYEEAERQAPYFPYKEPVQYVSYGSMEEAEREFLQSYDVVDCGYAKIESAEHPSRYHNNGAWAQDVNGDLMTGIDGRLFYTGGERELYDVMKRLPWSLSNTRGGVYKAVVYFGSWECISMGAVMWGYYHGWFTPGDRRSTIKQAHELKRYIAEHKLEPDHLTEIQDNNRPWAIAMIPHDINTALGDRRSQIGAPYYLYTAYDQRADQALVCCGVEGTDYQRRFIFGNLTQSAEAARQYLQCVINFKDAIPTGYKGKAKKEKSLLRYWGTTPNKDNPEGGANDPANPIPAMLYQPRATFKSYQGEKFEDIPIIEPEE